MFQEPQRGAAQFKSEAQIARVTDRVTPVFDPQSGDWRKDALKSRAPVTLRPWSPEDLVAYYTLLSAPEIWTFLPETRPALFDRAHAEALLEIAMDPGLSLTRAIEWSGRPVGQVRLLPSQTGGEAELSYWIGRSFWGNGFAPEAINEMLRLNEAQSAWSVFAMVHRDNAASRSALAQLGFRDRGATKGAFHRFERI